MCFCVYDLMDGTVNQFLGPYIGTISLTQISSGIFSLGDELFFILDYCCPIKLDTSLVHV